MTSTTMAFPNVKWYQIFYELHNWTSCIDSDIFLHIPEVLLVNNIIPNLINSYHHNSSKCSIKCDTLSNDLDTRLITKVWSLHCDLHDQLSINVGTLGINNKFHHNGSHTISLIKPITFSMVEGEKLNILNFYKFSWHACIT